MATQDELNVNDNSKAIRVDTTKCMQQGYVVTINNRQFESVSSFKWVEGRLNIKLYNYIRYKLLVSSTA
jgi:hypothetical protein